MIAKTDLNFRDGVSSAARGCQEGGNQMVQARDRARTPFRTAIAHIEAASFSPLDPAFAGQPTIRRTYGVGMNLESARQLAAARQPLLRREIPTHNSQDDLCDQLLLERNLSTFRKPELHRVALKRELQPGAMFQVARTTRCTLERHIDRDALAIT